MKEKQGFKIALIFVFILVTLISLIIAINMTIDDNPSEITPLDKSVSVEDDTKFEEEGDYAKCVDSVKYHEEKALSTVKSSGSATQEDEDWIIDYYKERKDSCKVFNEMKSVDELKPDTEGESSYYKNCVENVYKSHQEWRDKIIASWYNGEGIEDTLRERERVMKDLYEGCEKR